MIQAKFKCKDGSFVSMTVLGHALSGEYGHDLVCAAVSTLTFSLVNNLERLTQVAPIVDLDPDGGYLYCEIPADLDDNQAQLAEVLFKSCYYALKDDVSASQPDYLQVSLKK